MRGRRLCPPHRLVPTKIFDIPGTLQGQEEKHITIILIAGTDLAHGIALCKNLIETQRWVPFVVSNDLRKLVFIENVTSVHTSSHYESGISFSPCYDHEANLDVFCSNAWNWWFIFAQIIFYILNCLPILPSSNWYWNQLLLSRAQLYMSTNIDHYHWHSVNNPEWVKDSLSKVLALQACFSWLSSHK